VEKSNKGAEKSTVHFPMLPKKRKVDDMDVYSSSIVSELPKAYAHLIPLSSVEPDLQKYTRYSFPPIELEGKPVPWLDAYFERVHPRYPILHPPFVRNNYSMLPMFLLHSMYALTIASCGIDRDSLYSPGDYHYSHCKILFENCKNNPTPFSICATLFMSIYQMMFTTAVVGGISMLSAAIRLAQEYGYFRLEDITWTCCDGTVLGMQTGTSKRFLQLSSFFLYESDFMTSFLRKLPFMINEDIRPLSDYVCRDDCEYNDFYGLGLWRDAFKLLQVGRHIVTFMRNEKIDINGTAWNKKLLNLDQELLCWKIDASEEVTQAYEKYSLTLENEYPSPFAGYIYCLYHTLRILLYKPMFLYHLDFEHYQHKSIELVKISTLEIAKVFRAFKPVEQFFLILPFPTFYIAYMYASSLCFLTILSVPDNFQESLDASLRFLDLYSITTPQISNRAQAISRYLKNPKEEIKIFGSFT
jgi:hypothetical protein